MAQARSSRRSWPGPGTGSGASITASRDGSPKPSTRSWRTGAACPSWPALRRREAGEVDDLVVHAALAAGPRAVRLALALIDRADLAVEDLARPRAALGDEPAAAGRGADVDAALGAAAAGGAAPAAVAD